MSCCSPLQRPLIEVAEISADKVRIEIRFRNITQVLLMLYVNFIEAEGVEGLFSGGFPCICLMALVSTACWTRPILFTNGGDAAALTGSAGVWQAVLIKPSNRQPAWRDSARTPLEAAPMADL